MKLDLSKVLDEAEGLTGDEKICPRLSRFDIAQAPLEKNPDLVSFVVLCVGEKCGMFNACNPIMAVHAVKVEKP